MRFLCENDFSTNFFDMEDVIAKGFLKASLALDEWWAGRAVASLNANVGVNEVTTGKGTVAGTTTYVIPAYWDANLFGYFARVAIGNRLKRAGLISGANLFESKFIADFEACCENKRGKFGSMDVCFDLFNIDATNTPDLMTYMVNRGALHWTDVQSFSWSSDQFYLEPAERLSRMVVLPKPAGAETSVSLR